MYASLCITEARPGSELKVMKALDEAWNGAETVAELTDQEHPSFSQLDTLRFDKVYSGSDGVG